MGFEIIQQNVQSTFYIKWLRTKRQCQRCKIFPLILWLSLDRRDGLLGLPGMLLSPNICRIEASGTTEFGARSVDLFSDFFLLLFRISDIFEKKVVLWRTRLLGVDFTTWSSTCRVISSFFRHLGEQYAKRNWKAKRVLNNVKYKIPILKLRDIKREIEKLKVVSALFSTFSKHIVRSLMVTKPRS